jgi:hypothetical protein
MWEPNLTPRWICAKRKTVLGRVEKVTRAHVSKPRGHAIRIEALERAQQLARSDALAIVKALDDGPRRAHLDSRVDEAVRRALLVDLRRRRSDALLRESFAWPVGSTSAGPHWSSPNPEAIQDCPRRAQRGSAHACARVPRCSERLVKCAPTAAYGGSHLS